MNRYSGFTRALTTFANTLEYSSEEKVGYLLKPDKIFFHKQEKENYLKKYSDYVGLLQNLLTHRNQILRRK